MIDQPHPIAGRHRVLALLAVGTMINYLDRTVLGIAAPQLSVALQLTPSALGVVFSAFAWSYAAAQIPGGWLLDRLGNRLTYFLSVVTWSGFTLLQGFAQGIASLLAFRLGLGLAEAPCFPANSRMVADWFPKSERARATAVYTVGEYVGLAAFGPLLFWILHGFGWRAMFWVVGLVGIAFSAVWWWLYRDRTGEAARTPVSWSGVGRLLRERSIIGASLGQFGGNSTLVFFLTWFPTYLAKERGLDWIRSGFFAILPYLAAACGVMFGGWLSDRLLQKGASPTLARKLPVIAGLLGASTILLANFVSSDAAVIAVMSVAFFAQGMTGLGWTVISEIAPLSMMGLAGGVFNLAANLAGILTPLVIGLLLDSTGSFFWALVYVAAMAMLGACSYVFVLGKVERIESASSSMPS
ncbi:MAG: MFS transporter [Bryobacteraceae bacterium]